MLEAAEAARQSLVVVANQKQAAEAARQRLAVPEARQRAAGAASQDRLVDIDLPRQSWAVARAGMRQADLLALIQVLPERLAIPHRRHCLEGLIGRGLT
jgi:hypothetical protein